MSRPKKEENSKTVYRERLKGIAGIDHVSSRRKPRRPQPESDSWYPEAMASEDALDKPGDDPRPTAEQRRLYTTAFNLLNH